MNVNFTAPDMDRRTPSNIILIATSFLGIYCIISFNGFCWRLMCALRHLWLGISTKKVLLRFSLNNFLDFSTNRVGGVLSRCFQSL